MKFDTYKVLKTLFIKREIMADEVWYIQSPWYRPVIQQNKTTKMQEEDYKTWPQNYKTWPQNYKIVWPQE